MFVISILERQRQEDPQSLQVGKLSLLGKLQANERLSEGGGRVDIA